MEKKEIEDMIDRYNLRLSADEEKVVIGGDVNEEQFEKMKKVKSEILKALKKKKEEAEKKRKKEYEHLFKQLPDRKIKSENNDEKAQEILAKRNFNFFRGPESDGLNLNISAENSRLEKEAQKYCEHELEEEIDRTYTADARKKIKRRIYCEKCGLEIVDEVSDPVSDEAIWR